MRRVSPTPTAARRPHVRGGGFPQGRSLLPASGTHRAPSASSQPSVPDSRVGRLCALCEALLLLFPAFPLAGVQAPSESAPSREEGLRFPAERRRNQGGAAEAAGHRDALHLNVRNVAEDPDLWVFLVFGGLWALVSPAEVGSRWPSPVGSPRHGEKRTPDGSLGETSHLYP